MEHYGGIVAGYGAATTLFWALHFLTRGRWTTGGAFAPRRPVLEVALAVLAVVAVIGVGQLYVRGWLLPDEGEALQSLNQLLIFAPILLLALVRGQAARAVFVPGGAAAPASLAVGLGLAGSAILAYAAVRGLTGELGAIGAHIAQPTHISYAVQVLMEDLAIAVLLARLRAATGAWWTIAIVAVLFQLAHIPAFLADGATLETLSSLFMDTAIGLAVFGAVLRSRNILWFWPIHTVLDLMQFY